MLIKAYAKINLSLDVVGRREDGYHEVSMVMQQISVYDRIFLNRTEKPEIRMSCDLEYVPTDEKNLMMRAAGMMFEKYNLPGGLLMQLEKRIPVAAGMAGGSADAAAVFKGINQLFELKLQEEELCASGAALGADIPFCIRGGTCLCEGIGEKLTVLPKAPEFYMVLIKPSFPVSTPVVYRKYDGLSEVTHPDTEAMVRAICEKDSQAVLAHMGNVLEEVTVRDYPVLLQIKENLQRCGAEQALMSGSGPTVFGLFSDRTRAMAALRAMRKKYRRFYVKMAQFV